MAVNCASDSTATGICKGPDAAKPTNTAISMRGKTSGKGGAWVSNRNPGNLGARLAIELLHLETFVGERQLFHRDIGALRVEGAADVLDDARAQELPGLDDGCVIFVL